MYEVETLDFLITEIKAATGVTNALKGYPTFGRVKLTPPIVAIEIGGIDPASRDTNNRIGGNRLSQQWNIYLFGSHENEKVRLIADLKEWIRNGVMFTPANGPRITLHLLSGEPYRPLTDAQAEQYGYVFVIASH